MRAAQALRPKTREDCIDGERPCLWVSCRYNLYLDVTQAGGLKFNFPDREVWEADESCALDLADRGGLTLGEVGDAINLNRERIRQLETIILDKLRDGAMKREVPSRS